MKNKSWLLIVVVLIGILVYSAAYTVDETQQVVITQFGRIVGEPVTTPGLHFKIPVIQKANVFNKNLLDWDGEPGQIPGESHRSFGSKWNVVEVDRAHRLDYLLSELWSRSPSTDHNVLEILEETCHPPNRLWRLNEL